MKPCVCLKEPPGPYPDPDYDESDRGNQQRRKVKVKLADGKERTIQHIEATTSWSPDGRPMSAAEFIQQLFGDLPELFKDEDELRAFWSRPDTRKALLESLAGKGYGPEQLQEIGKMIEAERSDIFDVLAYIAFALPPVTRAERVESYRDRIFQGYDDRQQEFLDFVLGHYVERGVGELDTAKLPQLIELKYHSINDAMEQLGPPNKIRQVFVEFQQNLY